LEKKKGEKNGGDNLILWGYTAGLIEYSKKIGGKKLVSPTCGSEDMGPCSLTRFLRHRGARLVLIETSQLVIDVEQKKKTEW